MNRATPFILGFALSTGFLCSVRVYSLKQEMTSLQNQVDQQQKDIETLRTRIDNYLLTCGNAE